MTDPLLRATAALREKYDAAPPEGDPATRARVLDAAMLGRRERRIGRALLVPIAATFVLFATWAAATGRLAGVSRWVQSSEVVVPASSSSTSAPPTTSTLAASSAHSAPSVEPESPGVEPSPPKAPVREPAAPPPAVVASAPRAEGHAGPASPAFRLDPASKAASEEDAHYATAHAAHFEARDWPRALEAWNAYLVAHPSGRFAPEARYNRALCLLRLGQTAKGREALAPFADGREGGYRRAEATKLLETFTDANP